MDAVWIKTVRQLEIDLAGYRQMKRARKLERDDRLRDLHELRLSRLKESLGHRYSQLIAFTAGLSKEGVEFDCDLELSATVKRDSSGFSFIFGPTAISSVSPYLSPEFSEFSKYARDRRNELEGNPSESRLLQFSESTTKHLGFADSVVPTVGWSAGRDMMPMIGIGRGFCSVFEPMYARRIGRDVSGPVEQFVRLLEHRADNEPASASRGFGNLDFEYLS